MEKREYGLFTAIAMIVGIVIGSGIFFKSDNILIYTGGSIIKGVLVFSIAAVGIIFGSLSISILASKTTKAGGLITYADEYSGRKTACAFGWFQVFIYYPSLVGVLSWVAAVYICMLFNIPNTPEILGMIGALAAAFCFVMNILSSAMGGYFQNASTIIKMIPLGAIAIAGFIYGDPHMVTTAEKTMEITSSATWLAALAPVAFSYDGWVVSTSIAHELKNSKRNLPLALTIGPIFVLVAYILYFVGISIMVGPENIMKQGDNHVNIAAIKIFGANGVKIVLTFIVISVMGTLNGFILGFIRLPYSLALREMLPMSEKLKIVSEKTNTPVYSAGIAIIVSIIWSWINYMVQKNNLIPNSDVSEIPIVASYIIYIILYVHVIKLYRKGEVQGIVKGVIIPILAMIGSAIIIIGGLQNPRTLIYIGICVAVIIGALIFLKKKDKMI
ncbi:APC family permease [Fusobacterium ulcerans]|mgnify:FL=1|uniref:APC family permease n=1 Tax=Fusobacterium ulcerans TaxID=861 RepID=UPI0026DCD1AF|nr:APC family permease [Fusobacterium ulcerans]